MIKLPELLIEVDNELGITRFFMSTAQQENPQADDICAILATIMAHGCNIGSYTMSHLINGISYHRLKHITDWMLTEEARAYSPGRGGECHKLVGHHSGLGYGKNFKQ